MSGKFQSIMDHGTPELWCQ